MRDETVGIVKELLEFMGLEVSQIRAEVVDARTKIDIVLPEGRLLIGEKGTTLDMFQHIVRRIAAKKLNPRPNLADTIETVVLSEKEQVFLNTKNINKESPGAIDIDVNGYKLMREDLLRDFATDIAERVRGNKKSVELDPMPPADRRIVHLALSNITDVTSESMGEGRQRYIVVRPYP